MEVTTMKIKPSLFEEVEFDEEDIILIEQGLIGMPELKKFIMMDFPNEVALHWLQSLDDPDIGFLVSEPKLFDKDYTITVDRETGDYLRIEKDDDLVTMIIVTVKQKGAKITGNLLGPILVNASKRIGCQLTLDSRRFSTEVPLRKLEDVGEIKKAKATV
jgi:flagellar assembly factor FliW